MVLSLKELHIKKIVVGLAVLDLFAAMPATASESGYADIITVQTSGTPGSYEFSVTVKSPDKGCIQYANWWEVLSLDGQLLYRRVLAHSHVHEQPFTRKGGPVIINAGITVIVRAHMHPLGYGGIAVKGTVNDGFVTTKIEPGFAAEVEQQAPKADYCAW